MRAALTFLVNTLICTAVVSTALAQDSDAVVKAVQMERAGSLPRTKFYEVAASELHGKPGTLIRTEHFDGYALGGDVDAIRILYRSRSQLEHETVASAVVIVPKRTPPPGGWPVLVWAHGTTGVATQCAPSLTTEVGYYTTQLVKEGLQRNFAVIAVDYSGLGTEGHHEYLWKVANANDVAYVAAPAREAVSSLAPKWVAIGHSQGGQAVWGLAEKMATLKDSTYKGAVALAPAVDSRPLVEHAANTPDAIFYLLYVAFGINAVYPMYQPQDMLQPTGVDSFQRLTTQGCWDLAEALFQPVKPGTVLRKDWGNNPDVQKFFASNQVGQKPIAGPIFIASGDVDTAVPATIVAKRAKDACRLGGTVKYKMYPGDHETMVKSSYGDQMQWIMDRFQDRPAPRECPD
jgi:pimeloyl-ACP methyl ester carboxylesterase